MQAINIDPKSFRALDGLPQCITPFLQTGRQLLLSSSETCKVDSLIAKRPGDFRVAHDSV
jgi:hypothetical protein